MGTVESLKVLLKLRRALCAELSEEPRRTVEISGHIAAAERLILAHFGVS